MPIISILPVLGCAWHRVGTSELLVESIHLPTQPSPHPDLSIHPTNHPASHLFIIHQCTNPSIHLHPSITCSSIYPSRSSSQPPTHYSRTHSSIFLIHYPLIHHPSIHSPTYLSIHLPIHAPSTYLLLYLLTHPHIC